MPTNTNQPGATGPDFALSSAAHAATDLRRKAATLLDNAVATQAVDDGTTAAILNIMADIVCVERIILASAREHEAAVEAGKRAADEVLA